LSDDGELTGVLCAGQLLNRRNSVADRIRSNLYRDERFDGRDVAIVSLFLGDVRVATSATTASGDRAVGTLASSEVYKGVMLEGQRWLKAGYVVDDWYLTAYEPIRDPRGKVIGALGLGLLQRKFEDLPRRAMESLLALTIIAVLLGIVVSYVLSESIMRPVNKLIAATRRIAADHSPQQIHLDAAPPEIEALGNAFNEMALAIHERDDRLHRQTHEKLMRSDRLAMIGQLAAGVAHEINNPLGSILLFSRLTVQQLPAQGRARENLERIEKETKRCHAIVKSLLDFARERKPLVEAVDVNRLLDETLKLFEGQFLFQNIQVARDYDAKLDTIPADQSQLQQVFMNIVLNAVDAMKGKGRLGIATKSNDAEGTVDIAISDSGPGIAPENLERVFDPFFTTKGVGHGTGLGLSVSYGIVQSHNGDIAVASEPGAGATFTISLPAMKGPI
jgi:two-component system NtrC family sensor kinase